VGKETLKVGIVGSRKYENRRKIKEFIFKLKQERGTDTIIVSGGCKQGADFYAKKYALELGLQYEE
jgi:predicted Rossmann fold nucleotide-binding protein DprA/Smf involved in DNA uptake